MDIKMEDLKYRNEIKYVCNEQQLRLLEQRIERICKRDAHAGDSGKYTVRSVYFDDYRNTCFYENESGVDIREKFRIRIYDGDMSYITLECKQKKSGKNHKFACPLTKEQCDAILQGRYVLQDTDPPLLKKLMLQKSMKQLNPKVIVQYERTPYVYGPGNVRITFDRNISGSNKVQEFESPNLNVRPIMPAGQHVLEIKYDEFFPDFIRNLLQLGNLQMTSYSKYYNCRKFCK